MPRKHKIASTNIEKSVMTKIKSNQIRMKPRWYFVLGSVFSLVGLVSTSLVAVFLTHLTIFLLKQHGPNGQWRLQQILDSLPIWIPLLAVVGIIGGIWMLKKYDFSYKNNFRFIILMFIASILFTGYLISYFGLDSLWVKKGPMRRFYEQNHNSTQTPIRGGSQGQGKYRFPSSIN